jgi:hypothetical protein
MIETFSATYLFILFNFRAIHTLSLDKYNIFSLIDILDKALDSKVNLR